MHNDFAPMLQMLFHAALDAFPPPDAEVFAEQLLEECQQYTEDLCTMLLEYFGKHIVQPRHELFEKATSLAVSQSSSAGFLIQVEANAAMETTRQVELPTADADDAD